MKLKFALSILGSAAALTLAGCGGGGDGGGGGIPMFPVTPTTPAPTTPAPVTPAPVTPAPETPAPEVPVVETPRTWKDTDCAQTGTDLPLCTTNFSSNASGVTVATADGGSVLRFFTTATDGLAPEKDNVNEVRGNLAALGLSFLHGVKLSELPAIQYTLKEQGGTVNQYINITFSPQCDLTEGGTNTWTNLVLQRSDIAPAESTAHPNYTVYSAQTSDPVWLRSGSAQLLDANSNVVLNAQYSSPNTPTNLDAVIAAYPNACVFNYANPGAARRGPALTPGVLIKLGTSGTVTATEYTLKSLKIGDKVIFESKPVTETPPVELPPLPQV